LQGAVGSRIRTIREGRGIGLREAARALDMSHSVLWKWELGKSVVDADQLPKIAEFLGVDPCDFLREPSQSDARSQAADRFAQGLMAGRANLSDDDAAVLDELARSLRDQMQAALTEILARRATG